MQKDLVALKNVARAFDPRRARATAAAIWEEARWQDTPAIWRAARVAERQLRDAGLENVRIEKIPADGATSMAGWLMPPAWSVEAARLDRYQAAAHPGRPPHAAAVAGTLQSLHSRRPVGRRPCMDGRGKHYHHP